MPKLPQYKSYFDTASFLFILYACHNTGLFESETKAPHKQPRQDVMATFDI